METLLNDIVQANLLAFLFVFMRVGTALMVMPGIGDSFVPPQTRLLFAVAFSFLLTPFLSAMLPSAREAAGNFSLLFISEALIGIFIGTVMRVMLSALDTAGSIISIQTGFSNASIFNPATASQGTLFGTLYSALGVALLFMTNMHHVMLAALVDSYQAFPVKEGIPGAETLSEAIGRTLGAAFSVGVRMAMPFIVVGTLVQAGFGVLGRLMPQIQVFFLAMPVQIFLSLVIFSMALSAGMLYWIDAYGAVIAQALPGGK